MHNTTRRDFVQLGAWAGLGSYLARSSVFAQQGGEKINVGMVGVGGKGSSNLEALARTENIVALCDVDERHLAEAAAKHPQAQKYTDWRKLLEQSNIEAIVVSIPDHSHAVVSCAAMKSGKHVYCEKPLAHSIWEVRTMSELAIANPQLATQMGNAGHSGSITRRLVELVQSGGIGQVRDAHCWTNRPIWPQAIARPTESEPVPPHLHWDVWLGPAPERPFHQGTGKNGTYHPFNWRGWWDFGTCALGDMGCHIIDNACWALNLTAPTAVEAEGADPKMPESGPVWMIVRYEFPARNGLPPVKLTWYDGGKLPPADLLQGEAMVDNGVLLIGDGGTLYMPRDRRTDFVLLPRAEFGEFAHPAPTLPRPTSHYAEWIEAIKTGRQTLDNFAYAGPLTESVLLGNVAYRLGKRIEWHAATMRVRGWNGEAASLIRPEFRQGWSL